MLSFRTPVSPAAPTVSSQVSTTARSSFTPLTVNSEVSVWPPLMVPGSERSLTPSGVVPSPLMSVGGRSWTISPLTVSGNSTSGRTLVSWSCP